VREREREREGGRESGGSCWAARGVGRCHRPLEELALAFAMGTHERLVAGRRSRGKEAVAGGAGQGTSRRGERRRDART